MSEVYWLELSDTEDEVVNTEDGAEDAKDDTDIDRDGVLKDA